MEFDQELIAYYLNPWPQSLTGGLEEVWIVGLSNGEEVLFNYAKPDNGFIGLANVEEGKAEPDIWIHPNRVDYVEPVNSENRRFGSAIS